MHSQTASAALVGIQAVPIEVEVDVAPGQPAVVLVGLPDTAAKEARDRVKSAVQNSGFNHPSGRITINLAPAEVRKEGPLFDLPAAVGLVMATKQCVTQSAPRWMMVGELALNGSVRPVRGVLSVALAAREAGVEGLLVPVENAREASVVEGLAVYPVNSLRQAVDFLDGRVQIARALPDASIIAGVGVHESAELDFADVKGQESVKRAIEVAAAGGHNLLMIGSPGAGKSMLAKRIPTILPTMTLDEALEVTRIHSVAGLLRDGQALVSQRPFRSPHHTISDVGLIGGTANLLPGEVSLSHHGVLFLDELPEFKRSALEVLRQPLEDGKVTITRAAGSLTFPAKFMLVAAMNPTPTGGFDDLRLGKTSASAVQRYLNKISAPLLDRIDIHLEVASLNHEQLIRSERGESSETIRKRVQTARDLQSRRFAGRKGIWCNAQMGVRELKKYAVLPQDAENLLRYAMSDLKLSARAFDRILKVSRTIADLAGREHITVDDVAEAIQYRSLDRQIWG